jgi:hypothetical protein
MHELLGKMVVGKDVIPTQAGDTSAFMPIREAAKAFLQHVQVHSPDKPRTLARYRAVLDPFQQILGHKQWVEVIQRVDIEHCKATRWGRRRAGRRSTRRTNSIACSRRAMPRPALFSPRCC